MAAADGGQKRKTGRGGKRAGAGRKPGPQKPRDPRPKPVVVALRYEAMQEAARAHASLLITNLVNIATKRGVDTGDRIRASEAVLDRAYGKPKQTTEIDGNVTVRTHEQWLDHLDAMKSRGLITIEHEPAEDGAGEDQR